MLSANSIALASLKQSEGAQGAISRILLTALNESLSEDGTDLSARSVNMSRETMPETWARCNHNILIHIDTVASQSHVFCESRLDALAHALDAADPILCVVESITGFVLDPVETVNIKPIEHVVLEISRVNEIDRIFLACPVDVEKLSEFNNMSNRQSIDLSDLLVEYSLFIKSPNLDIECLAELSVGDIVILGNGPANSTVKWHSANQTQFTVDGSYDFGNGEFSGDQESVHETIDNGVDDTEQSVRDNATLFPVNLKVRVNGLATEAKSLAALQVGIPFHAGRLAHGLDVSIFFGEKEIFGGNIVKIGDSFAVTIGKKQYNPDIDVDNNVIPEVIL